MHIMSVSDYGHLFYDPYVYGFDTDFFTVLSGTVSGASDKIRVNTGEANSTMMFMYGDLTYSIAVPTAPTTGDDRTWGIYSKSMPDRNAAFFVIDGENFSAKTSGDNSANTESTDIEWDSDWTDASTEFKIHWRIDRVQFSINGRVVATHFQVNIPKGKMTPMYFENANADDMDIDYIEINDAKNMYFIT